MGDEVITNRNIGHGHVFPRPDGVLAKCGGPAICSVCAADLASKIIADERVTAPAPPAPAAKDPITGMCHKAHRGTVGQCPYCEIERLQLQVYTLTNANKSLAEGSAHEPPLERYNCTTGGMELDANGEYVLFCDLRAAQPPAPASKKRVSADRLAFMINAMESDPERLCFHEDVLLALQELSNFRAFAQPSLAEGHAHEPCERQHLQGIVDPAHCEHDWWRMKDNEDRCLKCDATRPV